MATFFGPSGAGGDSFEEFLARLLQNQGRARRPVDITRLLTRRTHELLGAAGTFAAEHGHAEVDVLHLLRVMMEHDQIRGQVAATGADPKAIAQAAESRLPERAESRVPGQVSLTQATQKSLLDAYQVARGFGSTYIDPEHVFLAFVLNQESSVGQLLAGAGVSPQSLQQAAAQAAESGQVIGQSDDGMDAESETPMLDAFGHDLTAEAREDLLDPVIGRSDEIAQTIEILARRTKNNPVLIGEAGVGKTAVVEGLARAIVADEVPAQLRGRRVISLDLAAMLAGTKYRGDFEERLTTLLDEITAGEGEYIVFIDEVHTVLGAGGGGDSGGMDAGNILKPRLARGELHLIGATTLDEFRRVEKDPAFARRFQPVTVDEPSREDAVTILMGLKERYEEHHSVQYTDEAVRAAVEMSARYITDRHLPDKAIDLIDQAGARVSLTRVPGIDIDALKATEDRLESEKSGAVAAEQFEEAARLRDEIVGVQEQIAEAYGQQSAAGASAADSDQTARSGQQDASGDAASGPAPEILTVDEERIAEVVARATGVPVSRLTQDDRQRLAHLEEELHEQVIGQDDAVKAVAKSVRRSRVGMSDESRPVGSFLFLGPTGVGKTELARALATSLFGDEDAMVRFDMSEFGEKHTASRLVGAPPGYVGYDEAGQLTERVRRRPYSVVLLDEVEKAHPDVFNLLLQVLDDGRLTDGQGRTVDFRNTVIIMTSNLGSEFLTSSIGTIGFSAGDGSGTGADADVRSRVMGRLRETMRPEFLNRIDDIVLFRKLDREQLRSIVRLQLKDSEARLAAQGISLTVDDESVDLIADHGYEPEYGARPLRRVIQRELDDAIADLLVDSAVGEGDRVKVTVEGDALSVVPVAPAGPAGPAGPSGPAQPALTVG
ncbi:ATP-dependent Clp protease ATP-binding subunit ClpC [Brevibacterium sp. Mu109]|uniref:ATP-dependent Clp protease ATP-binding subunit n=1 Tax=Brevibacterium sp. Mu109 TaxID=1255669 RepID=UPI000C66523C|nr:ATP-dependent Clp protease ATP-binding subunit [Brevibacterium sp. Mu109]SMX94182.1 ATP-dependent Clp protease ATP-binding subunit ClpC [Brevibacterium sp. Mu109]